LPLANVAPQRKAVPDNFVPVRKPKTCRAGYRAAPAEHVEQRIYTVRDQRVMLDSDLAALYQVTTGNLNLAVARNKARFPADFMFQLTKDEYDFLLLQSARAKPGRGGRRTPPHAFTELGVAMLSSVLHSERAIQANILIMRAFVRARAIITANKDLARRITEVEAQLATGLSMHDQKLSTHEQAITGILKSLRDLMNPPQVRAIGFTADLRGKRYGST
jgi:hypothetical protein